MSAKERRSAFAVYQQIEKEREQEKANSIEIKKVSRFARLKPVCVVNLQKFMCVNSSCNMCNYYTFAGN